MDPTTITLTFCERGENHKGNQMVGQEIEHGFSCEQVRRLAERFEGSELIELNTLLEDPESGEDACVLVIRCGVDRFINAQSSDSMILLRALLDLDWDRKVYSVRHGKVVNKHARANLIFAQHSQQPCYEEGKGTIVAFTEIPLLDRLKDCIHEQFINGCFDESIALVAEGNLYQNNTRQGIGWHGDSERKLVIGVRLGGSMRLKFAWFHRSLPVSPSYEVILNHGDIYVMSSKAVGSDWHCRSLYTVRHCAGSGAYTRDK